MERWKDLLKNDPTDWLLEETNPSVRYFTLVNLLDRPADHEEVVAAREAIRESEPVRKMLRAQRPQGYWGRDKRPYHCVTKHLITLEHLGYQGDDERVHNAIEYLFAHAQMEDGAFTAAGFDKGRRGVIPCFTANAVHFLHWFGYGEDARTQKATDYLLRTQRDDDGWLCFERVKKTHACFWATAKVLRAFDVLPPEKQTADVQRARQRAIELFLKNSLYRHHSEFGKVHPSWFEFARPLFASTDVLEVLELLVPHVSLDDERIQKGLQMVLDKQNEQGRWPAERQIWVKKTFPMQFADAGQPSKWVTLHALSMLKRLCGKPTQPLGRSAPPSSHWHTPRFWSTGWTGQRIHLCEW